MQFFIGMVKSGWGPVTSCNRVQSWLPWLALALMLAVNGLLSPLAVPHTFASISLCNSDPVVILSNNTSLDMRAAINDVSGDVKSVLYTIHAPIGTSVVAMYHTPSTVGAVETFYFVADEPMGVYNTITVVRTATKGIAVTAETAAVSTAFTRILADRSVSGTSGERLRVHLTTSS